jgi:hypothetical protein
LSGRCCFCDELITRPEESYRLWWVVLCDLETSSMRRPWRTEIVAPNRKILLQHVTTNIKSCFRNLISVPSMWKLPADY